MSRFQTGMGIVVILLLLGACSTPASVPEGGGAEPDIQPTAADEVVVAPTDDQAAGGGVSLPPTAVPVLLDPARVLVIEQFFNAINAGDEEAAMAFFGDEIYTQYPGLAFGATRAQALTFVQSLIADGENYEVTGCLPGGKFFNCTLLFRNGEQIKKLMLQTNVIDGLINTLTLRITF